MVYTNHYTEKTRDKKQNETIYTHYIWETKVLFHKTKPKKKNVQCFCLLQDYYLAIFGKQLQAQQRPVGLRKIAAIKERDLYYAMRHCFIGLNSA